MVAALELHFDVPATRRIRVLWDLLEEVQVPTLRGQWHGKHRPHVSLTGAPSLDPVAVAAALDGVVAAPPLRLNFQFAGVFVGRVVFLGVAPSTQLIEHQAMVWSRLSAAGIAMSPLYAPGDWVPHCTVSMRVPRPVLTDALRRCLEVLPIEARVTGAAVVDYAREVYHPLP